AFHERNLDRHRNWPATLLATSTHDTKRSEDVRARMVAISEIPELWRRSLQRWRTVNRRWKKDVNELEAPDANEEYSLYQSRLGAVNALAQALLKLMSPGVPDIYQGNEVWNYSLVDPDNRRPVDYKVRAEMLSCLSSKRPEDLLQNWPDGRIKMFLTQRALHF